MSAAPRPRNRCWPLAIVVATLDKRRRGAHWLGKSLLEQRVMGEILRICFVGLIVGVLARFLYPGAVPMGFVGTIGLGLGGSLVGGLLPRIWDRDSRDARFSPAGFGGSILGAFLLILIGHSVS